MEQKTLQNCIRMKLNGDNNTTADLKRLAPDIKQGILAWPELQTLISSTNTCIPDTKLAGRIPWPGYPSLKLSKTGNTTSVLSTWYNKSLDHYKTKQTEPLTSMKTNHDDYNLTEPIHEVRNAKKT